MKRAAGEPTSEENEPDDDARAESKRFRTDDGPSGASLAQAAIASASALQQAPQCLTLSDLRLELIPEAAYGLTSLVELWLCDNRLTELPPQIGTLRGLRQLWVGSNRLVRVPKCIKHNKQLRSLGLENNLLTDLVSFARMMALDRC